MPHLTLQYSADLEKRADLAGFTGSMIMSQTADRLKRVHFELGGKNPVIVFADADLERAADAAIFMIYSRNGERCTSSSRLLLKAQPIVAP